MVSLKAAPDRNGLTQDSWIDAPSRWCLLESTLSFCCTFDWDEPMSSDRRNLNQRVVEGSRCLGLAVIALLAIAVLPATTGWGEVRAEPDDETDGDASYEVAERVELPVESIRLASDRLSLQESLEISASVVLPDSCHSFERLEGAVDEENLTVRLVAVGDRQGNACSQALAVEETVLLMYPLPSEGIWTVEARYFDEPVRAELTVTP